MQALIERIRREGRVLSGGFLKVDGFLNHQLDPELTLTMGEAFRERFAELGVARPDRILTAEASGIAPALAAGVAWRAPVVYARKRRPATMPGPVLEAHAPSRTQGGTTPLIVAPEALHAGDQVLIVDDFLATGLTIRALAGLVHEAGARLAGIGVVIEKPFQAGRSELASLEVPVVALAAVDGLPEGRLEVRAG